MYLGAVGAYDWSGTVVKYDRSGDSTPDISTFEEIQRVLADRTKDSYLGMDDYEELLSIKPS